MIVATQEEGVVMTEQEQLINEISVRVAKMKEEKGIPEEEEVKVIYFTGTDSIILVRKRKKE